MNTPTTTDTTVQTAAGDLAVPSPNLGFDTPSVESPELATPETTEPEQYEQFEDTIDDVDSPEVTEGATDPIESGSQTVTIDGQEYNLNEVQEALTNYGNGTKWEKSLTERSQAIAEKERLLEKIEQMSEPQKPQEPIVQLTPEEQESLDILENKFGFIRKDKVEQQFNELNQKIQSFEAREAKEQIVNEATEVGKKYGLSTAEKNDLIAYAAENKLLEFHMEDVYLQKNKDKFIQAHQEVQRITAGKNRQGAAGRTEGVTARQTPPTLPGYDSARDKNIPVSELAQRALRALQSNS